ncbi:hypothetical protein Tco_1424620, partial [Tanacetum coccineum]
MSDSKDSMVTYTAVSSPFRGLSDIGSPGVDGPPSPDFVAELVYPKFMPPKDEVLPAEEQPLPIAASPTAESPGYVPKSDPKEDPEEDDDEDPEEDLTDYPADGGDDGDDEDESSDDDEDEDVDIEGDKEKEEHPAPTDSIVVALLAVNQAPSVEETEPFETEESMATPPPHLAYLVTTRISIRDEPPTPFWSDTEVARLLAIPTPPPSPLSPWSSALPQIPSPPLPPIQSPLPILQPLPVSSPPPASPICPLGYRAAMIQLRAEAPSTSHSLPLPPPIILSHSRSDAPSSGKPPLLPILLPTLSPPLHLLSTERRADRPEVTLLPQKSYGITDTWDEMLVHMPGAPVTNDTELGRRMTEFTTRVRQDTDEIYMRLDDEQSERQLMAGRLNMLYRDRHVHARTCLLMEREARMLVTLHDQRLWHYFIEALKLQKRLQSQMTEFERQQGPAKGLAQPDAPGEAGVTAALAVRDADRNTNGDDSHNSGISVRRTKRTAREFENQVKLATCTLHSVALTWWNTQVKIVGHDAAYETGNGDLGCEESDKIEKYVSGLPDMIHRSVVASKPKTMQDAVEIATEL